MTEPARRIVLGLGNTLNRDEGLGVFCLEPLRRRLAGQADIEILDGGVLGMSLLPLVESCSHLLILDAVDAGLGPGEVAEIPGKDIPLFSNIKLSWHQLSFQEVLQFANVRGRLPANLHLIGIQPGDISIGVGLSPVVEAAVPEVTDRALRVLGEWRLL